MSWRYIHNRRRILILNIIRVFLITVSTMGYSTLLKMILMFNSHLAMMFINCNSWQLIQSALVWYVTPTGWLWGPAEIDACFVELRHWVLRCLGQTEVINDVGWSLQDNERLALTACLRYQVNIIFCSRLINMLLVSALLVEGGRCLIKDGFTITRGIVDCFGVLRVELRSNLSGQNWSLWCSTCFVEHLAFSVFCYALKHINGNLMLWDRCNFCRLSHLGIALIRSLILKLNGSVMSTTDLTFLLQNDIQVLLSIRF